MHWEDEQDWLTKKQWMDELEKVLPPGYVCYKVIDRKDTLAVVVENLTGETVQVDWWFRFHPNEDSEEYVAVPTYGESDGTDPHYEATAKAVMDAFNAKQK
jgi:hypothetical protein